MAAPKEVEGYIRKWILDILEAHKPLVRIVVQQRAKFEGWLKLELAAMAVKQGAQQVEVEPFWQNNGKGYHSDLAFRLEGVAYHLELKTPNTSYRLPGVRNKSRPITKNITGIINDARKLRSCPAQGVVAFVLFPVKMGDRKWYGHLRRIRDETKIPVAPEEHCVSASLDLDGRNAAALIVCTFLVPKPGA